VLGGAVRMVCAGLGLGASMVVWGRPLAARLIQDLKPESVGPLVFGSAAMIAIALLASYVPVRRATRLDPMEALRHE